MAAGLRALATVGTVAFAASLDAQTVRGTVTAGGSGERVSSGIVALLDETGRVVAATMSDDSGSYALQAPGTGRYTLRVERVGYRSTITPAFTLATAEVRELPLTVSGENVALNAVRIVADKRCVVRPQQGLPAAEMWNEARKALDATRIANRQRLFTMRIRRFERELEPGTLQPTRSEQHDQEGHSGSPFVSISPDTLRRVGFVQRHADGSSTYYAPDAEVLLSDAFLDAHCLMALPPMRGLVGLMFEPVQGRKLPDVKGVLWFDPRSAELRFLQFDYVNLGLDVPIEQTGGRIDFDRLPGGRWIVRRWHIRMPMVRWEESPANALTGGIVTRRQVLFAIREVGGEILEVRAPGARRPSSAGSLSGRVYDSLRRAPLPGVKVFVSGTGVSAVTDDSGRYRIDSVPPGSYTVSMMLARLDSLPVEPPNGRTSISTAEASTLDLALPSHAAIARARCATSPGADTLPLVFGHVRDEYSRRPVPGAAVRAAWQEISRPGVARLAVGERAAETTTDASGRFLLCSLPVGRPVVLRANRDGNPGPVVRFRSELVEPSRVDILVPGIP